MIYATNTKEILFFFAPDNSHYENRWGNVKMSEEYDQFNRTQIIVSDFDREVRRLLDGENGDRGEGHGKEG